MAKKGMKLAKGQSLTSDLYRPDFLTEEEAKEFQHAKKNYNEFVRRNIKKIDKLFPEHKREDIVRTGWTGVPVYRRVNEIRSRNEYEALMELMDARHQDKFAEKRAYEFRNTLIDVIDNAYNPDPEQMDEIRRTIDSMSDMEIVKFRFDNPTLVKDFFFAYDVNYNNADGTVDADDMEQGARSIVDALRVFGKKA